MGVVNFTSILYEYFVLATASVCPLYLFAFVCHLHLYITNLVLWLQQADKSYLLYCYSMKCFFLAMLRSRMSWLVTKKQTWIWNCK